MLNNRRQRSTLRFGSVRRRNNSLIRLRLNDALRKRGVRTWFSHDNLDAGQKIHESIFFAIESFDRLIVVLSEDSMKSQWVNTELHRAYSRQRREKRNVIFPISIVPFSKLQGWVCFDSDSGKDLATELREYLIPIIANLSDDAEFDRFADSIVKGLTATRVI